MKKAFINCVVLSFVLAFPALGAYTIEGHVAKGVESYVDLTNALKRADIETIIVTKCITLPDGSVLDG